VSAKSLADPANTGPVDSASIHVDATPEQVWDVVSDLGRLREWSPECYRIRWMGTPTGPVVGARFLGFNKAGWKRWFTRNVVEEAQPGQVFGWLTRDNKTRWTYRLSPDRDGTLVTESRTLPASRPFLPALAIKVFLGGLDTHDTHMRDNIRQSLDRLKVVVESKPAG
jgi:uncharacterized protein YndB with AHSA1/START domain